MGITARLNTQTLTPEQFASVADIAEREAGLVISPGKLALVQARLAKRMKAQNIENVGSYIDLLTSSGGSAERQSMIAALTTNVTAFFREAHHFDALRTTALPPLLQHARSGGAVRIWSAGCSTGEEAYSIAMTLHELDPAAGRYDLRILASDISPNVLTTGRAGRYMAEDVAGVPPELLRRHFQRSEDGQSYQILPHLRELVRFRRLNLMSDWPMRKGFDIIFCRNVVIYFSREVQLRLWARFSGLLSADGWLFLGHSERLGGAAAGDFRSGCITGYQKTQGNGMARAVKERFENGSA